MKYFYIAVSLFLRPLISFGAIGTLTVTNLAFEPTFLQLASGLNSLTNNSANTSYVTSQGGWNIVTQNTGWVSPFNLSCVGINENAYQQCLIAPNWVLTGNDYGPAVSDTITFQSTNGLRYTNKVVAIENEGDMCLEEMQSNYPSTIVSAWLLPPWFTNYLYTASITNIPCFWPHKNSGKVEYIIINSWSSALYPSDTIFFTASTSFNHGGALPSGGDSGSPVFMDLGTADSSPVLLYPIRSTIAGGPFVADWWNFITNNIPVSQLKIVNFSLMPTF